MHGPPLTRAEINMVLATQVTRLVRLGVPWRHAVNVVAADNGIATDLVADASTSQVEAS